MAGPQPHRRLVDAVVLAAGAASRFGSVKLLAELDGRPLLQHVLDSLAAANDVAGVVVVLGDERARIERAIAWRGERRVVNPDPRLGLASSLRIGLAALPPSTDGALVVLGDQPRLQPGIVERVVAAWRRSELPIVVPRYPSSGTLNPVLLDRSVWPTAMALRGDRGMGPLIRASPELVLDVAVTGDNPDVDTPADLRALAGEQLA